MTFFKQVDSFAKAVEATEDTESIVKIASDNGVSRNDLIVLRNLTVGNVFTGTDLIKVAEDEPESVLLEAVTAYEKLASGKIDEADALDMVEAQGLTAEDLYDVSELLNKKASEAGIVADEAVWEKIAASYDYLLDANIDPVTALEFASEFSAADSEYAQDKVASEFDGLDNESIDKIAEVAEYLSDIEGVAATDLMAEYAKEAGMKEMAAGAGRTLSGAKAKAVELSSKAGRAASRIGRDLSGANVRAAEKDMKAAGPGSRKQAKRDFLSAKKRRNIARGVAAGGIALGGAGAGGYAMHKQASEMITADDEVWDKVAEAHDFLSAFGLDPVTSMEFAETFSAADSEYAQDKVASEFDGLDNESIDKIAEAFEYLSDIEGASLTDLMDEVDKEAGVKERALELVGEANSAAKRIGRDLSGANVKAAEKDMKAAGPGSRKQAEKAVSSAKRRRNIARGVAAGGIALGGAGAATFNGRG